MAGLEDEMKGILLNAFREAARFISLHSGDPTTGGVEIAGGEPPYERQRVTWATPAEGSTWSAIPLMFDVPPGAVVTHIGYWSARAGGRYWGSRRLQPSQAFDSQGVLTVRAGQLLERLA